MENVNVHINYPLEEQDDKFVHIQDLIESKRNFLIKKQKNLRLISKQNHFLETVQKDYSKYYNFILKQKNDQIQALEMLENYICDLTKSGNLTKYNIDDAKEEQRKILREIKSIRINLNSIINDTDDVYGSLQNKIN